MDDDFRGFGPDAFAWFEGLERDNSKAYFTATRDRYETDVRGALTAMLELVRERLGGDVRMFRQHRDLRFSRDKSPYKTRTYGLLERGAGAPPLYAELSAHGLYAGTGYHQLARDQLTRYRDAVVDERTGVQLAAHVAEARAAGLDVEGEALATAPRGYPRDHPRVALLRHKALIAGRRLPGGDDGIAGDAALEHVIGTWRAAQPLLAWLDAHVGPSTLPRDERGRRV